MTTANERLARVRSVLGLTQKKMADALGLKTHSYSNIEQGILAVHERHAKMLRLTFNVNEEWLLTGNGEMFLDRLSILRKSLHTEWDLTDSDTDFIVQFISASAAERDRFRVALDAMRQWALQSHVF